MIATANFTPPCHPAYPVLTKAAGLPFSANAGVPFCCQPEAPPPDAPEARCCTRGTEASGFDGKARLRRTGHKERTALVVGSVGLERTMTKNQSTLVTRRGTEG